MNDRNIVLFGTGSGARRITEFLNERNIHISYYVDNNIKKWGETFSGKTVKDPHFILYQRQEIMVIIASMFSKDISQQLENMGFVEGENYIKYEEMKKMINKCKVSDNIERICGNYFSEMIVTGGPFGGMKYLRDTEWAPSLVFTKLIGAYEEPIHSWVKEAISNNYNKIINIGSAEGYYSIGFAFKNPHTMVYSYDINNSSLLHQQKMANLNKTQNIRFSEKCDFQELNKVISENSLIFCDIEGDEKELLNPSEVENMYLCDFIIELHDHIKPGVTDSFIGRFQDSHNVEIVTDFPRSWSKFMEHLNDEAIEELKEGGYLSERRSIDSTRWMRLTSKYKKK